MKINQYNYTKLATDYSGFLERLDILIKSSGLSLDIRKTKLYHYQAQLNNLHSLDNKGIIELINVIVKYLSIGQLLEGSNEAVFDKNKLFDLAKGTHASDDSSDAYNGSFFEFSMASRFAQALGSDAKIDMGSMCDVVIDGCVGVECKYVISSTKLYDNINKAIRQLEDRLANKSIVRGFVAIDLSNVLPKNTVDNFIHSTFERFVKNHLKIIEKDGDVISSTLKDKNFSKIIYAYLSHEMEVFFHEKFVNLWYRKQKKMNPHILAVLYQFNRYVLFEYDDQFQPLIIRSLSYFENTDANEKELYWAVKLIQNLGGGI